MMMNLPPPPNNNHGDIYSKYRRMLKMGIPLKQVEMAIRMDGLDPNKFNVNENNDNHSLLSQLENHNVNKIPPPPAVGSSDMKGDILEKYKKMVKTGFSLGAVELKMKQDGVHDVNNVEIIRNESETKEEEQVASRCRQEEQVVSRSKSKRTIFAGKKKAEPKGTNKPVIPPPQIVQPSSLTSKPAKPPGIEIPLNRSKTLPTAEFPHPQQQETLLKAKSAQNMSEIQKSISNGVTRSRACDSESELQSLLEGYTKKLNNQDLSIKAEIMNREIHSVAIKVKDNPSVKLILWRYDQNVKEFIEATDLSIAKSLFEEIIKLKDVLIKAIEFAQGGTLGNQVVTRLNNIHKMIYERLEDVELKLYI